MILLTCTIISPLLRGALCRCVRQATGQYSKSFICSQQISNRTGTLLKQVGVTKEAATKSPRAVLVEPSRRDVVCAFVNERGVALKMKCPMQKTATFPPLGHAAGFKWYQYLIKHQQLSKAVS